MSTIKQIPVLGIDTTAWLTSWVDGHGRRSYFVGAGTANQRLNLPSEVLRIKTDADWNEFVEIEFDTEMFSCMDHPSSLSRKIDYMFACSRCGIKVRLLSGLKSVEGNTPLVICAAKLLHPHAEHVRVRLDIHSVYDLAKFYCRLGTEEYGSLSQRFPLESGSLLTLCHGVETALLKLETKIGPKEYEATLYTQAARTAALDLALEMPTFQTPQRIGEILR